MEVAKVTMTSTGIERFTNTREITTTTIANTDMQEFKEFSSTQPCNRVFIILVDPRLT